MAKGSYPLARRRSGESDRDIISYVTSDWNHFQHSRQEREAEWAQKWRVYLTKPRRARRKGRSNAVSPHGAMAVRLLRPLIKKGILTADPVVTTMPRKIEVEGQARQLDKLASFLFDQANVRRVVLTDMLTEALTFGISWGFVEMSIRSRDRVVAVDVDENGNPVEEVLPEILEFGPRVRYVPLEDVYWDPQEREVNDEMTIIHRFFRSKSKLMEDPNYKKEEVERIGTKGAGRTSVGRTQIPIETIFEEQKRRVLGLNFTEFRRANDRMQKQGDELVELIQVTSNGNLFTVANRNVLVREESLDIPNPWFDLVVDPIPGEIMGKGIFDDNIQTLDQRDFLVNAGYDNIANIVHKRFMGLAGMYDKKSLRGGPGSVLHVRSMNALQPLDQGDITPGVFNMLSLIDRDWERGSGVSEILSTIGSGAGTVYPETATVGTIKQDNALAYVTEMISHVESSLVKMMKKIWDVTAEFWTPEAQLQLAGESGADALFPAGADTLARDVDFQFIGPRYAARKQEQTLAMETAVQVLGQVEQFAPGTTDWKAFAREYAVAKGLPKPDDLVPDKPKDKGPAVEHQVMMQGVPVQPEQDEDHERHLMEHMTEMQRAMQEGEDQGYIDILTRHVEDTMQAVDEMRREAQLAQAQLQAQAQGGAV